MKNRDTRASNVALVIANLIPLAGVLFFGWDPKTIFVIYILESVVVGIFNVIKMLSVYFLGNREAALRKEQGDSRIVEFALIPFFIIHYFFFVYAQCMFFFAYFQSEGNSFNPVQIIRYFEPYVFSVSGFAIIGMLLSYTISYALDFMLNGDFTRISVPQLMVYPYKRIFIQQLLVLAGGFIYVLTNVLLPPAGLIVYVTVFTAIKIGVDIYFENKLREAGAD